MLTSKGFAQAWEGCVEVLLRFSHCSEESLEVSRAITIEKSEIPATL